MSGQSIVDRLNAAKHTVAGSALGRAVVKATTEEIMPPKRKHLDYLLQCTSEINVSIPQMADLLIERTQNTSWVVSFKSLITIHHLMCYGNERFSQYMASHNSKFVLSSFMDKTAAQGIDMTSYIRKYAYYLNEKRETYKLMGYDFCKVKRGKDDGLLRTMNTEKLLKTLPILQKQLDALVQFDVQPNELTNGVINGCFVLMSKDLIRLFACYNDGVINLLEKFFDMNKKNCKEALEIYKKFLDRTDNVSAFLKVAESSGMDKSDIPDLTKAPSSLLEALESHVNGMENKKGGSSATTTSSSSVAANGANKASSSVANAINSLNSNTAVLSNDEKQRVLDEEAKILEQYKNNHLKKQSSLSSPTSTGENPFGTSNGTAAASKSNQDDLFGLEMSNGTTTAAAAAPASDDLLMLSGANPFIQNLVNQSYGQQAQQMPAFNAPNPGMNPFGQAAPGGMMMTGGNGQMGGSMFPPQNSFPMNQNQPSNQNRLDDLFSGLTYPTTATTPTNAGGISTTEFDAFGDVLQPTSSAGQVLNPASKSNGKTPTDQKFISKDLDSSLASLADNLDIKGKTFGSNNQKWQAGQPQQNQMKTGGQNYTPPPMSAAWNNSNPAAGQQQGQNWQANPFATGPMQQPAAAAQSTNPFGF